MPDAVQNGKRPAYARELHEYEGTFETKIRQLCRWIATGIAAGEPPPLDDPPKMAAWWTRHMKHRVPAKIAALAVSTPPPAPAPTPTVDPHSATAAALGMDIKAVRLADDAGPAVQQAFTLVCAAFVKIEAAYTRGDDASIRLWMPRWKEAIDAFRRQQKDDIASRKILGLVIDRAGVEADILQALALFKQMREFMTRRILERIAAATRDDLQSVLTLIREIPSLSSEAIARLVSAVDALCEKFLRATGEAIETERAREDTIFRDLPALKAKPNADAEMDFNLAA